MSNARAQILDELESSEQRDREMQDIISKEVERDFIRKRPTPNFLMENLASKSKAQPVTSTPNVGVETPYQQYRTPPVPEPRETNSRYSTLRPAYDDRCEERESVVTQSLFAVARELKKPTVDINKFSGNPIDYIQFLRQFDSLVVANTDSFDEKLNYLLQFTTGEAHKIVSGYSHLEARTGYVAARKEFQDRYGDPEIVAQAYVRKALDWPVIKPENSKSLDDFAIFLTECQYAIESIEAAKVL